MKEIIKAVSSKMMSEVNEGEFYVLNNKNRALTKDGTFTDQIGADNVVSFKTKDAATKAASKCDAEEGARSVLESDVCSYGWIVNEETNEISPIYTLNTLLNRATNESYHKNIMDAQAYVEDAPNREERKAKRKVESAISRLKNQAEKLGLTPEQLLKQLS